MITQMFLTLPVADLPKSVAFFQALGFSVNPQFSDETAACIVINDTTSVMLGTHDRETKAFMKNVILPCLVALLPAGAGAEIYKWTDAAGKVHFSDNATGQAKAQRVDVRIVTYTHVTYQKLKSRPEAAAASGKSVIMYGTSWCGYCKKAREYFRSRGIAFTDLDVETDANAKVQFNALGGGGVPVILVGDTRINGFSEPDFDSIYNQR